MLKGSATKRRWRGGWCYRPAQESGLAAVGLLCLDEEDPLLAIGTYLEEQVKWMLLHPISLVERLTLSSSSLGRDQVVGCTSRDNMRSKGMYNASLLRFKVSCCSHAPDFFIENRNVMKR